MSCGALHPLDPPGAGLRLPRGAEAGGPLQCRESQGTGDPGPGLCRAQTRSAVRLEDGRTIDGRTARSGSPGVSLVYCTDTVFSEAAGTARSRPAGP